MKQKLLLYFMTLALLNISLCAKADLKKTVSLAMPGTISEYISEGEKNQITDLTVAGDINGDDVRFIREMAGVDVEGNHIDGNLVRLDISDANIVEGGDAYFIYSYGYYKELYMTKNGYLGSSFFATTKLRDCILPKSIKVISSGAFAGSEIRAITISDGLVYIGDYAFANCQFLESLTIPSTVTYISKNAFYKSNNILNLIVDEGNMKYASVEGGLASKDKTKLYFCLPGIGPVFNIPESITMIEPMAFESCSKLTQFTVDATNTIFEALGALLLDNKNNVVACAPAASGSVTIPDGIENISESAFCNSKVQEVVLPQSLKNISHNAFSYSSLSSVSFSPNVENSQLKTIQSCAFWSCDKLTKFKLPSTLELIGDSAFSLCSNLEEINIPAKIKVIPEMAFYRCSNIKKINLPAELKGIGEYAFSQCSNISELNLPTDLDSISGDAFSFCTALKKVVVPRANKYGRAVFLGCTGVETVEFLTPIDSIPITMFRGCGSLKEVSIPEGVKSVKFGAFCECSSLEKVALPESLEEIDINGFCLTNIKEFIIPKNVKKLGSFMLSINDDVTVYAMSPVPPIATCEGGENAFSPRGKGTLYVPAGSKEAYLAAAPWNEFGNIYEFDPAGVDGVMMEDGMEVKEVYSSDGTRLDGMQPGMNIVRTKNGRIHKVIVR